MEVNRVPWEEKKDLAYFWGKLTGDTYGEHGEAINRLKLMLMAEDN